MMPLLSRTLAKGNEHRIETLIENGNVRGGWRKLRNEFFRKFYSSPNIIKV